MAAYLPHPASNGSDIYISLRIVIAVQVKAFKPVTFLLMIFVCFMPAVIMSETPRHHCVSNSATSRKKDALHVLSHPICNYSCAEKNTYTFTYLGSLATLYTFYQKMIRKQAFFYILIFFLVILFIMNRLRNTKKVDV